MTSRPEISIVVPVRDAWDDVRGLLAALDAQEGAPTFEVLLVDDHSTEPRPADLALGAGSLRIACSPVMGAYPARNHALELARGPILAFTDADCRPVPGWLAAGYAALRDATVVAGEVRIDLPDRPNLWAMLDAATFLDQRAAVRAGGAVTANLFVRAPDVRAVGGFRDADLPAGLDYDLVQRIGGRLTLAPDALVRHPPRGTRHAFLSKLHATAVSSGRLAARRGGMPRATRARAWVPAVGRLRHRSAAGLPLAFHNGRPEVLAARPGPVRHVTGAVMTYAVVPYVVNAGVVRGYRQERQALAGGPPVAALGYGAPPGRS